MLSDVHLSMTQQITRSSLFRSFQIIIAPFKLPSFVPTYRHAFNDYLLFDTNYATLMAVIYIVYYLLLEPIAAVSLVTVSVIQNLSSLVAVHSTVARVIAYSHGFL